MSRRSVRLTLQLAVGAAACASTFLAQRHAAAPLLVGSLFVSLVALDVLDLWLPRGDVADVSAAIAVGCVLSLDATTAMAVVLLARGLASLLQRRRIDVDQFTEGLTRAAAAVSLSALLAMALGASGLAVVSGRLSPRQYAVSLAVSFVYVAVSFLAAQIQAASRTSRPLGALILGNLRFQGWILAAEGSVGVLSVVALRTMGAWGLVLMVILLLVMRQSFLLLIEIRQAYDSMIEVMARTIEAHDPARRGHAERVSRIAVEAAKSLSIQGQELESVRYAALLHDVGLLGVDDTEDLASQEVKGSAAVLGKVEFLSEVVPILQLCDDPSGFEATPRRRDALAAYLVSRTSELDEEEWGESAPRASLKSQMIGMLLGSRTRSNVDSAVLQAAKSVDTGSLAGA